MICFLVRLFLDATNREKCYAEVFVGRVATCQSVEVKVVLCFQIRWVEGLMVDEHLAMPSRSIAMMMYRRQIVAVSR